MLRGSLPRDRRFTPLCTLQLPQLWGNNGIIFTSNASKFSGLMSWLTASGYTVFSITAMSCFIDGWISTEASMRQSGTYYYGNQCPCPQRFMIPRCTALWCKWNVVWCHMMLLHFKLISKKRFENNKEFHRGDVCKTIFILFFLFIYLAAFNENTFFQQYRREMSPSGTERCAFPVTLDISEMNPGECLCHRCGWGCYDSPFQHPHKQF